MSNAPDWIELSRRIESVLGITFSADRLSDLKSRLVPAADAFGFANLDEFANWLLAKPFSRVQVDALAKYLTIGETYFFRNGRSFEALRTKILPDIFRQPNRTRRELRVWSAACSTGEEPYSVAMVVRDLLPPGWTSRIYATDINSAALERARRGIYREWSFREMLPDNRRRYFSALPDGTFEISPEIREMVTFSAFNLVSDAYPSVLKGLVDIDIIFCRNVLIYFSAETNFNIVQRMEKTLAGGGYLLVAPAEAPQVANLSLKQVDGVAACFQKQSFADVPVSKSPVIMPKPVQAKPLKRRAVAGKSPASTYTDDIFSQVKQAYRLGDYEQVTKSLKEFFSSNGSDITAHSQYLQWLIHAYANQKNLDCAEVWCRRAIEHDKINPLYYYLLATILLEKEQVDPAREALKRTLFLDPDFVMAHFLLANLHRKQGNLSAARRQYRILKKLLQAMNPDVVVPGTNDLTVAAMRQMSDSLPH